MSCSHSLIAASALLCAAAPSAPAADLDFYKDVYPVLKANCISCHNKTTTKGKLNMESPELMKQGGESGPGLVVGKSAESLIVQAAAHSDPDLAMPPKNNKSGAVELTSAELGLLKSWIDQGAKHSVQQARTIVWQALPQGVNPIYTVAMTKDGRYAACGRANQIFIYDLATRQFVTRAADQSGAAHRSIVQSLAFSPDGNHLASGSFREVKIWRLEKDEAGSVETRPAAISPVPDGLLKQITAATKVAIVSGAMSPDGKQVVAGCADGSLRIWDAKTAAPIIELRGSVATARQAAALEWTIGAQGLEQAFYKAEIVRIDAQNKSLEELLKKANDAVVAMNKALPEKEKAVKPTLEAKAAAQKALEAAQALLAKTADGKPDTALSKQLKDAQEKLATTTMTETSALAAFSAAQENIKDAQADQKRITEAKAQNVADSAKATAAIDAAKKVQDKATADLAALKEAIAKGDHKPAAVGFSADSQKVAALMEDGALRVWAVASGLPVEEVPAASAKASTTLATGKDGGFVVTKAATLTTSPAPHWVLERVIGGEKSTASFADRVNAVRFSPDGKTLAVGGGEPSRSGDISLWDVATGKLLKNWPERHTDAVVSLDFSPDGKLLASGGTDKLARVTDVATGKQVQLFEGHSHHVLGVAFRADGRTLATAGGDGVVLVWDMLLGERKKKIEGWIKEVTSIQYVGATAQIITSAGDNLVRIVNDDGTVVRAIDKLPDFMQAAASAPNAALVIGGGEDSFLRVWDGTTGKELATFGAK